MKGNYKISEGCGAPEAKIRNTAFAEEIAKNLAGRWRESGWIPKDGADRLGLNSQERFELFKDGIEWTLAMWGCFSEGTQMFSELNYRMRLGRMIERLREFLGGEENLRPFEEELGKFMAWKWGAGGRFYWDIALGGIGKMVEAKETLNRMNMAPSQKLWLFEEAAKRTIRDGKCPRLENMTEEAVRENYAKEAAEKLAALLGEEDAKRFGKELAAILERAWNPKLDPKGRRID